MDRRGALLALGAMVAGAVGVVAARRLMSGGAAVPGVPVVAPEPDEGLVGEAIRAARRAGLGFLEMEGAPRGLAPAVLEALRLPNGAPLTPAMKQWLAFDARAVRWFDDLDDPTFRVERVDEMAAAEYSGTQWLQAKAFRGLAAGALPGLCLALPRGSESRRFVYLSDVDATGEYPVLLIDVDDVPFVCVEYPGLDVYLATAAGAIAPPKDVYGAYADDPRFASRMAHHIRQALGGRESIEVGQPGFLFEPRPGEETEEPPIANQSVIGANEPVPAGFEVVGVTATPFGGPPLRRVRRVVPTRRWR